MKPEIYWIPGPWAGRLAIAARPRGGDWVEDEVNGWRLAGIDTVVSLVEREEAVQLELLNEGRAAEKSGIRFISFPIPDRGLPASTRDAVLLMAAIAGALEEGKNVAVHCRQGIGRSGMFAAGVVISSGTNPQEAIRVVTSARGIPIPETSEPRAWTQTLPSGMPLTKR